MISRSSLTEFEAWLKHGYALVRAVLGTLGGALSERNETADTTHAMTCRDMP